MVTREDKYERKRVYLLWNEGRVMSIPIGRQIDRVQRVVVAKESLPNQIRGQERAM